jgi:pyruvate,water dikinase
MVSLDTKQKRFLWRIYPIEDEMDEFEIKALTRGYKDKTWYFVDTLSNCLAEIACSRYPQPVIVQMSDLNTQEYVALNGGRQFEPERANRTFELRGASRYLSNHYRAAFALECQAVKRAREEMGLTNISIMIPHCRNLEEADGVLKALKEEGLVRGKEGLRLHLSCDYESNAADAKVLVTRFDAIAIAAQRLRRMALARKSIPARNSRTAAKVPKDSLKEILNRFVTSAHAAGRTVTVRGRNSRELQDLIRLLVELNVDAISVNPDAMPRVRHWVAEVELGRTS